jgi:hypothetical protein
MRSLDSRLYITANTFPSLLAVYMAIVTFLDFRNSRSKRLDMDDSTEVQSVNSYRAPNNAPEVSKA